MTDFVKVHQFFPHQLLDLGLVPNALAPRSTVGPALDESTIYAIDACVFLLQWTHVPLRQSSLSDVGYRGIG